MQCPRSRQASGRQSETHRFLATGSEYGSGKSGWPLSLPIPHDSRGTMQLFKLHCPLPVGCGGLATRCTAAAACSHQGDDVLCPKTGNGRKKTHWHRHPLPHWQQPPGTCPLCSPGRSPLKPAGTTPSSLSYTGPCPCTKFRTCRQVAVLCGRQVRKPCLGGAPGRALGSADKLAPFENVA
jgi:hypothetical protein